jgi:uncharacterized protein YndB with AHSA1/START domain
MHHDTSASDTQAVTPSIPADTALRSAPAPTSGAPLEDAPQGRSISVEVRTSAPVDHAWAAWAEPDKLAHWFVDRAYGDVRPGGVMTWVFEQFGYEIPYPVLEATAPERLVFGGEIPGYPPFRLEITIAREGGETVVRLFNSGFRDGAAWDDEYQGVASGWRLSLALLRHYLEAHYGTPKRTILALQPAPVDYGTILSWFTDASKLSRWLTRSGAIGAPGTPAHLVLQSGETVRGTVLEVSRQEAAVTWDDENIALELKAFSMGPTRMVGVRATGWGVSEQRMASLADSLGEAVGRLARELAGELGAESTPIT